VCTNPMSDSFAEYRADYELWEIESGYFLYIGCNIGYSKFFDDGTLRVTAIPTQHCPHSHAFLLEAEGKSIVFTGDLRHPTIDFPQVCFQRTCDLIVCEAAHFSTTEAAPIFEKAAPKRVLINHICPWRHLPSIETVRQSERSYEFDCVWDGYELTL